MNNIEIVFKVKSIWEKNKTESDQGYLIDGDETKLKENIKDSIDLAKRLQGIFDPYGISFEMIFDGFKLRVTPFSTVEEVYNLWFYRLRENSGGPRCKDKEYLSVEERLEYIEERLKDILKTDKKH